MKLIETLERIERVDQLIRLKATGSPKELASRLEISERCLYKLLDTMKTMGATIYYCYRGRSYCYESNMRFSYGFSSIGKQQILGGCQLINFSLNDLCSERIYI